MAILCYEAVIFKFSDTDDSRLEFSYETPGKLQHPKQLSGTTSGKRLIVDDVDVCAQASPKLKLEVLQTNILRHRAIPALHYQDAMVTGIFVKALCEKMVKHTSNQPSPVSASNLQISSAAFVLARGTSPVIQSAMSSFAPPFLKAWKQQKEVQYMTNHSSTCQEPKSECIQKKHTSLLSCCLPRLFSQSNATAMSAKKLALQVAPVFLNLPVPMIALQQG